MNTADLFPPDAPDPFDERLVARISPWLARAARAARYTLDGEAHLPSGRPALLVCTEAPSALDVLLLAAALRAEGHPWPRFALDADRLRWPAVVQQAQRIGLIEETMYQVRRRLMGGALVLVTAGAGEGFAQVAFKAAVPVVPVAFVGKRLGPVVTWRRHRVGPPISTDFLPGERSANEVVERITAATQAALQALETG